VNAADGRDQVYNSAANAIEVGRGKERRVVGRAEKGEEWEKGESRPHSHF